MTKEHFELIAETIKDARLHLDSETSAKAREQIAYRFAESLEDTNERFDRERFLAACGVER